MTDRRDRSPSHPDHEGAVAIAASHDATITFDLDGRVPLRQAHVHLARLTRQRGALTSLSRSAALESGDIERSARELTEAAAHTLDVARASIWMATDARDGIRCIDLFEAAESRHSGGLVLARAAYPAYFAALDTERVIAADDARTDPRTAEFADVYLRPLGIAAMLDAPIWDGSTLLGVVCLEHVGAPREWTDDEQSFAALLADYVTRALIARERRRSEAAIRESAEYFRALTEYAPDIIMIIESDGSLRSESAAVERLLGFTPSELIGRSAFETVHPDDQAHARAAFAHVLAHPGETMQIEVRRRHKDGSWRDFEAIGRSLLDVPAVRGLVINFRDVTDRTAIAARLARQRVELERSNRELEHFAYVASHDLQEPLRKIQAFGERLADECGPALGAQGETYLARMRSAAGRMQALIGDLLSFSRIATKPQPFQQTSLDKALAAVLSDLEVRIQQTGAHVDVGPLGTIAADPLQCRQLLQNLVGNALKFHRADVPPRVSVRATFLDGPDRAESPARHAHDYQGPWCRLEIQDNGIGFDEKYLDRIFNPFQRLHGRGTYEGTGMGLAICRKIVERHGGTITATSVLGVGTTFIAMLPLHRTTEPTVS